MRVGMYLPGITPDLGGGFTVEDDVFRGLLEKAGTSRHHFIIFCPPSGDVKIAESGNIEVVCVRWLRWRKARSMIVTTCNNILWRVFRFPRLIQDEGYLDGLLSQHKVDVYLNISQPSYMAAIPYIAVQWDLQHRVQSFFPEVSAGGRWYRWEERFSVLLRRAARVITGSQAGKREIELFYHLPAERIRVIPLPVPSYVSRLAVPNSREIVDGLGLKCAYLLYPAQFWPHKNHFNLLRAFKILRDQGCDLDLVLVGSDKGNTDYVKHVATELGVLAHVHFLGFVERVALIALYQEAFALSFVTFFGPDNIPPLEAFALGCPVVASRWTGVEEQLGDAALIAEATNPEEIAREILRLYDPGLRATLIEKGRHRARLLPTGKYIEGLFSVLDDFEPVRRSWGQQSDYQNNYPFLASLRKLLGSGRPRG